MFKLDASCRKGARQRRSRTDASCGFYSLLTALGMLLSLMCASSAHARPEYARKENRACKFCHDSASPGSVDPKTGKREPTTRNGRGIYYASHNLSFEGYAVTRLQGPQPPSFKYLWRADFDDRPRRVAVADVTGDGMPRLVMLHEKPDKKEESSLTVRRWDGKAFVTEFTGEVKASADKLQVGAFAGAGKPAVIVTADALWKWDGKTFVRTPSPRPLNLFGNARLKNGEERLLIAETPQTIKAHRVNLTGANWLGEGMDAPQATQVLWEDMHAAPEFFDKMEMPALLGSGGLIGLWEIGKNNKLTLYHVRLDQDYDIKPDPQNAGKPQFILKHEYYTIALLDPLDDKGIPIWTTPRLDTKPLDVVVENARGDKKSGLLILTAEPKGSKSRSLHFLGLE